MEVKMYAFEKCVIASYNTCGNVISEMDKLFLKTAVKSHLSLAPCEETANKLLAMIERKDDLLYLRQTVKTAFKNLSERSKKYLLYKFFGKADAEIDEIKNTRKYFRRQLAAIVNFSDELKKSGLDEETFKARYLKFAFLSDKYAEFSQKQAIARSLPSSCYKVRSGISIKQLH